MLKIKYIPVLMGTTAILATMSSGAAEISETGELLDGIAAIVNEGVVLKSQLREQTALVIQRASQANPPMQLPPANILREQLLERLILEEIQLQRADQIGLRISDQMLNEAIGQIAQQNSVSFEEMPEVLAADGIEYGLFRRDLRKQMTLDQLQRIDVGQRISVSPREIQQCIADLENNVAVQSDYDLSHILVSIPETASSTEVEAARAEADDIYRQLQDGADFRELALRYSDAQTALEGGSLGWMKGDQLPTLYSDVVVGLEPGQFSGPIRSASSFHIVKVNDMRSAVQRSEVEQTKVRHILITLDAIIDDETARQQLENALERIRNGEDFGEIAKLLSDDPGSAALGGDLGWAESNMFAPAFEAEMQATEVGEISEPFKSMFGWHILQVMDRRIYDNTEDLKESNCIARIRNSKMDEELQLWMQRIRDEAFVDTRV